MSEPFDLPEVIDYSALLVSSFARMTGESSLMPTGKDLARELYTAPFAVVSHGIEADPIFRYANRTALELWQMTWAEFTLLPSRFSVEEMLLEERERLLAETSRKGYVDTYEGVRIAKDGQRFTIKNTILWNVEDEQGVRYGQACVIRDWDFLPTALEIK